jgi:hypothetical protein
MWATQTAWAETSARFSGPARVVEQARPITHGIKLKERVFIYNRIQL